jgi:hypothetical protein
MSWLVVLSEPCDYCAIWIGPHRHMLRSDGALGIILERLPASGTYTPEPGDVIAGVPEEPDRVVFADGWTG